jgi:hypothetical protein
MYGPTLYARPCPRRIADELSRPGNWYGIEATVQDSGEPSPAVSDMNENASILASYTCGTCDIQGKDLEVSPGLVLCWNCGDPAVITARVTG